ncbi:MAG: SAM-dependent methyltransferase [Beijerinckiaceae bacterium]
MNGKLQDEFLQACATALRSGSFRRAVMGYRDGQRKSRVEFAALAGAKKNVVRRSDDRSGRDIVAQMEPGEAAERMSGAALQPFQSALLCTPEFDLHYAENRKREARLYKAKPTLKGDMQPHNKPKNYVLAKDRPYLQGLGVSNASGEINASQFPKFRQIANFVEIIDRSIRDYVERADTPITLLDLGCGKGYLTFAAYDYIRTRAQREPQVTGVDLKFDVIALCNELARKLAFEGLHFRSSRIEKDAAESIDILVALHACDTATDDALALGIRSGMRYFFCAPCCQAEIAGQLEAPQAAFEPITRFPLMRRRQADIITDVCRALLLNACGYEVTFLEFTALEHTPKNIMLAGKKSASVDRKKALADYFALKKSAGFSRHALETNIGDLL